MGLPLRINRHRTHYLDPKSLLTLDQDPSAHIPGIDEMLSWGQICLVQLLLNLFGHRLVGFGRKGCGDMCDEVRECLLNLVSVRWTFYPVRHPSCAFCSSALAVS